MCSTLQRPASRLGAGRFRHSAIAVCAAWATLAPEAHRAAAQERSSQAAISFQGYYMGGSTAATNISGMSAEFRHFIPSAGLLSGSLTPYFAEGRFRMADNYLELAGTRWMGQRWTIRGGDFYATMGPGDVPFTNIYFPLLSARGVQIQASGLNREYGFFWGHESVLAGPRVPFRITVPQTAAGAYVKQKYGSRLVLSARVLRLTSGADAIRANPDFFGPSRSFSAVDTASVQALVGVTGYLKLFSEVSASFGIVDTRPQTGTRVPLSLVAGPVLETKRLTFKANYVSQSASYLPMAGAFTGDRQGPFAEVQLRPFQWLNIFGAASRIRNNLEHATNIPTFQSSFENAGISVRLPFGFAAGGGLSLLGYTTSPAGGGARQDSKNRQVTLDLSRSIGRHSLRLAAYQYRVTQFALSQRQTTGELSDSFRFGKLSIGGAMRAQLQGGLGSGTATASGRGSLSLELKRLSLHGNFEAGSDLRNRTVFATRATTTTSLGAMLRLSKTWGFSLEGERTRLLTELNPENVFFLQNNGALTPAVLSLMNRWTLFFRLTKQLSWGKPIPRGAGNLQQYAASQTPLVGTIEGFVWQQGLEGKRPAADVPVVLDQNRASATGADGHFRFSDVAAGQHRVVLSKDELPAEYERGAVAEVSTRVDPRRTSRVDLDVVALNSLRGRITGPKDVALQGIVIRLLPTDRYTTPYPGGGFRFDNLAEGDYVAAVDAATLPAYAVMLTPARIPSSVRVGAKEVPLVFQFDVRVTQKPVQVAGEERIQISKVGAPQALPALAPLPANGPPVPTLPAAPLRHAPPTPPAAIPDSLPARGLFAIQVGAFHERSSADRLAVSLSARYPACRVAGREGSTFPWRVLIGNLPTAKAAGDLAARARKEFPGAFVVRSE